MAIASHRGSKTNFDSSLSLTHKNGVHAYCVIQSENAGLIEF